MPKDRKLNTEERILWGKVARSARALPGKLEDLMAFEDFETPQPPQETPSKEKPGVAANKASDPGQAEKKPPPRHHPLEKPVKRKLARGRLALEARIDLHGMVQSEAHVMLLDFLIRAHERGMRHVLIITGKGSSMGSEGALKRAVPMWFSKPEFRYLISSHETAAQHHGGEGALYVRLSRRRGETS